MSKRTQGKRGVLIFTAFLAVFAPILGNAGAVSDAQEQLNKAYDDYYDAVSAGGKKTPEEQKALRSRIVDPAMNNLNQAMKKESDEAVQENAKNLPASSKQRGLLDSSGTGGQLVREVTPEVILESTDIPKELEFPGKPKTTPSVIPSYEPYAGPYAPKSH
jgi:hypothetical protein